LTSTTAVVTANVVAEASRKQEEAAEVKNCVGAGEQQLAWQAHGPWCNSLDHCSLGRLH